MHERIPEIPDGEWGPFFLYTLGPGIGPDKQVRTGKTRLIQREPPE
jgi:hypothetical protein